MSVLNAWSEFLDARILQEKSVLGEEKADDQALAILETLCATYPQNPSFLMAKAWSLSVLNREPEAASSVVEAAYLALTHRLSGENDIAQDWIRELENLKVMVSAAERTKICTSAMAW